MRRASSPTPRSNGEVPALTGILPYVHIVALWGLAVAQPILSILARQPEFLVIRRLDAWDVALLVAFLLLVVALPAILLSALGAAIGERSHILAHTMAIALPLVLLFLFVMRKLGIDWGVFNFAIALLLGLGCGILYIRTPTLRLFVTYLTPGLLLIPALFLFSPGVSRALMKRPENWTTLQAPTSSAPVFFIVLDELSVAPLLDEHLQLNSRRFPNFAELASRSTWFSNAVTVSDGTNYAVPAILTGEFPQRAKLPDFQDHPRNLFTMLGGAYSIWAREAITSLCPEQLNRRSAADESPFSKWLSLLSDLDLVYRHMVLPNRYASKLPPVNQNWRDFRDTDTPQASDNKEVDERGRQDWVQKAIASVHNDRASEFRQFLATIDSRSERWLYFYHMLLPHVPLEYVPSGRRYRSDLPGLENKTWTTDEWLVTQAYQRYILQLQFTDVLIGEFIKTLEERGIFDRSLIVLLADHGVGFVPGAFKRLTEATAHEVVPVPLLIKKPHQERGDVYEDPVSVLDVLPTILDLLGVDLPSELEGTSVFSSMPRSIGGKVLYVSRDATYHVDAELFHRRDESVRELIARFGDGSDPLDLYRAAPNSQLLGRDISELTVQEDDSLEVNLDAKAFLEDWRPSSSFSPARMTGQITAPGRGASATDVVIAVNGTVWATTRTHGGGTKWQVFSALGPEAAWKAGSNRVDVMVAESQPSGLVLHNTRTGSGPDYELYLDQTGATMGLMINNRRLPIQPGAVRGWINRFTRMQDSIVILGWAADSTAAADEVLLFNEQRLLARVAPVVERPDVAKMLGDPSLLNTGFRFEIPIESLPRVEREGVRIIAVSADRKTAADIMPWYQLHRRQGGTVIESTDGRALRVREPLEVGSTIPLDRQENIWLLEATLGLPSGTSLQNLLSFREDRFHIEIPLNRLVFSGGMSPAISDGPLTFEFSIPTFGLLREDSLRIFAVLTDGTAVELQRGLEKGIGP